MIENLIDKACRENKWVAPKSELEKLVREVILYSFQNTDEDFNMVSIQGNEDFTNDRIYEILTSE